MTKKPQVITKDNFWETDLKDIEGTFLKEGTSVTDLPIYLNDSVPPQGVILPLEEISPQEIMNDAREKLSANLSIAITSLIFLCVGLGYLSLKFFPTFFK